MPGGTLAGTADAFIAKFDDAGNLLWTTQFGGVGASATATDIAIDSAGNVFVSGGVQGAFTGYLNAGGWDGFLAKCDGSTGALSWVTHFGTTGDETVRFLAVDLVGNVFVSSWTTGAMPGCALLGEYDAYLAKFSPVPEPGH